MSNYTGYNMPPGVSNVDIPGFLCGEEEDYCTECGNEFDECTCGDEEEDEDA